MSDIDDKVPNEKSEQDKNSHTPLTSPPEKHSLGSLPEKTTASTVNTTQNDSFPPSPKRRRLSPPETKDDLNIEAAAERALANTLGSDSLQKNTSGPPQPTQQNGSVHVSSTRPPLSESQSAIRQARLDGLPNLDSVTQEILTFLARLNSVEIGEMLFGPPSPRGHEYRALKAKFEQTKKTYQTIPPFLSPQALDMLENGQVDIIRKVNIATFMASIFSGELGMRVMDMSFIDIFVPDGGRLLKAQASIYLELKTQAFVAAARTAPQMLNQVMLDLFPNNMINMLLQKRPSAKTLTPTEQDFLNRLNSRRDILWSLIRNNQLQNVHETYSWNNFSREVSTHLTKYVEGLLSGNKARSDANSPEIMPSPLPQGQMEHQFSLQQLRPDAQHTAPASGFTVSSLDDTLSLEDFIAQAARAAEIAMANDPKFGFVSPPPPEQQQESTVIPKPQESRATIERQENSDQASQSQNEFQHYNPTQTATTNDEKEVPHSSQTAPTQVLYERARQVNKGSPSGKKNVPPSHRRPWTTEEENALMTGLDHVRGPHWSQILAMYGPGGTVNESLKDRNQVQLKDKARNLKLFFLKAGIEVPYYLQAVTGDLKSRAPGQAEKMGRDKVSGDDEQNSVDEALDEADSIEQGVEEEDPQENSAGSPHVSQPEPSGQSTDPISGDLPVDEEFEAMIARAAAQANADIGTFEWP